MMRKWRNERTSLKLERKSPDVSLRAGIKSKECQNKKIQCGQHQCADKHDPDCLLKCFPKLVAHLLNGVADNNQQNDQSEASYR